MFNLEKFISREVTGRDVSMFLNDIENHSDELREEIEDRSVLVIGGAGSIGSSYIRAILPFKPKSLTVVDVNENGLAELTRDIRSTYGLYVPEDYTTYPINYDSDIFHNIFTEHGGYDIVANFSAHKHVRSEKDRFSVQALLENNVIRAGKLLDLLAQYPPRHFFCVSTDKAANPVNVMGASKRVMEDLIMSYSDRFNVTTARFANVAFSNGSLPAGFIDRMMKHQPIVAPADVRRYFVSPEESGQICMLASILGKNGEIFFPKLDAGKMMRFSVIADRFIRANGYEPIECMNDDEARRYAAEMPVDTRSWPVVYFKSDTTGEKDFEEFFVEGEDVDMSRFSSLGVILPGERRNAKEVMDFIKTIMDIFADPGFTKQQVVDALCSYLPNFHHEEKGKSLDHKM